MAKTLRITTFNIENLFNRYLFLDRPGLDYEKGRVPGGVTTIDRGGQAQGEATTVIQRNNTARAILECKPDILAVQEVEDLWALRYFNERYLHNYFGQMIMIEGNDGRGIDVGLCIKHGYNAQVQGIRTYADDLTEEARKNGKRISRYFNPETQDLVVTNALFSRDCLAVDLDAEGVPLTIFVNHLKAQASGDKKTQADNLRREQARRVAELVGEAIKRRFVIVTGDLNDDLFEEKEEKKAEKKNEKKAETPASLEPLHALIRDKILIDPFQGTPPKQRWTYYYTVGDETNRFDYVLVDGRLAGTISEFGILRKGLTLKCEIDKENGPECERYPTIGYEETEASDHCPVSVTLDLNQVPRQAPR